MIECNRRVTNVGSGSVHVDAYPHKCSKKGRGRGGGGLSVSSAALYRSILGTVSHTLDSFISPCACAHRIRDTLYQRHSLRNDLQVRSRQPSNDGQSYRTDPVCILSVNANQRSRNSTLSGNSGMEFTTHGLHLNGACGSTATPSGRLTRFPSPKARLPKAAIT